MPSSDLDMDRSDLERSLFDLTKQLRGTSDSKTRQQMIHRYNSMIVSNRRLKQALHKKSLQNSHLAANLDRSQTTSGSSNRQTSQSDYWKVNSAAPLNQRQAQFFSKISSKSAADSNSGSVDSHHSHQDANESDDYHSPVRKVFATVVGALVLVILMMYFI